ncbi:MAG: TlpA disulfide reductase family protein, partial [Acidobacteriota bacterium]
FQVGASERPQLLFFFNTRCGACRENQTHWRALYDTLGDSTDVLGVSLDNPAETAAYVERLGLPFPTVSASDPNALAETLGLTRIPETVRVGTDGTVTDAWLGVLTTGALAKLGKGV